ncbi:hypothetical protein SAMN02910447_00934 [Ruminococcus sp. YE71]|uniref:hypothetical protein n=1 Tax=unclassified Ruminococcus TaxID=2608920 RepID=UPI0008818BB0|nr:MULTISPECIES: hypothetical protein [unclassified Ruminococcus]SDA15463.1 hypothetical protein SAMN02910446_00933 [Ruminococcus sp. YE78]SFW22587.1 hypothetical protein SAMN02910447_00934 [Ruminococcus sp. YE71]
MKKLTKTYIYRALFSLRYAEQLIFAALMAVFGAVLAGQLSKLMLSGELPQGTLASFRTGGGYTLGVVRFGSVMQLRMMRTKDFITGLLCTEGLLSVAAVVCVKNVTDVLRYGGAANAVSRGAKRRQVFGAMCVTNIIAVLGIALVTLAAFTAASRITAGFKGGGIADLEDVGIILRQLVELTAFSVMCTAVAAAYGKPLRAAMTLLGAVLVLPTAFGYMRIMYGTDFGLPKVISFVRMLQSGMLLPNIGDVIAAAGMAAISVLAGITIMNRKRIDI